MEQEKETNILELVLRPAFLVKDGVVTQVNHAAYGLPLASGMHIQEVLLTGQTEYEALTDGCLYLQLSLGGTAQGASVTRTAAGDLFLLDDWADDRELRAMGLAARELRGPLSGIIAVSDHLLSGEHDPKQQELLARMSRGLYQLQRILGNMSDAGQENFPSRRETRNISQVFSDIFEKAAALAQTAGAAIDYQGIEEPLWGLLDDDLMERAVFNIISNSMKFLPKEGGRIHGELSRKGNTLCLSLQDNGSGIPNDLLPTVFQRYTRSPMLEDSRYGLGLGMVLIRRAAEVHGGTVLIDRPQENGTRITLTIKIQQSSGTTFRTPKMDLTGGRDQALIELSQVLPIDAYKKEL